MIFDRIYFTYLLTDSLWATGTGSSVIVGVVLARAYVCGAFPARLLFSMQISFTDCAGRKYCFV